MLRNLKNEKERTANAMVRVFTNNFNLQFRFMSKK